MKKFATFIGVTDVSKVAILTDLVGAACWHSVLKGAVLPFFLEISRQPDCRPGVLPSYLFKGKSLSFELKACFTAEWIPAGLLWN